MQKRQCLLDITIGRTVFDSEVVRSRTTEKLICGLIETQRVYSLWALYKCLKASGKDMHLPLTPTEWSTVCVFLCKLYAVTLHQTMSVLNKWVRGWCSCKMDSLSVARQISFGDWLHLVYVWGGYNNCCNRVAYYTCGNFCISSQTCYIDIHFDCQVRQDFSERQYLFCAIHWVY